MRLRCAICRRSGRVQPAGRPATESIAAIVRRAKCATCGRGTMVDTWIGRQVHRDYEMQSGCEGESIVKLGLG